MKRKILIIIETNTYFNELHRLGKTLRKSLKYEPVLFFPSFYPTLARDMAICLKEGFVCFDSQGARIAKRCRLLPSANARVLKEESNSLKNLFKHYFPKAKDLFTFFADRAAKNIFAQMRRIRERVKFGQEVISKTRVSAIVVGGDLVHYDTKSFIRAAHSKGIPALILPCTMSNALEMAESYFPLPEYSMKKLSNRIAGCIFPEWVYCHRGKKLIRLPAYQVWAMKLLRISPPHPWINNSGFADYILAESEQMVDYYTCEGIPESQVFLTGALSNDILAKNLKESEKIKTKLYEKYGLVKGKPLIVSALPPDQLYMVGGRPKCIFSQYNDLVGYWVGRLSKIKGWNVIINPHPSVNYEDISFIEKYPVAVSTEDITNLIPACDLFIASVSSVIRWAIACEKPVLNYDVYHFNYSDYKKTPGVLITGDKGKFEKLLFKLTQPQKFYVEMVQKQKTMSRKWGNLDGKSAQRIFTLLDKAILEGK